MEACRQLKEEYDACFNEWFSQKFLKGDHNDSMCARLLKVYKDCVEVLSRLKFKYSLPLMLIKKVFTVNHYFT